MVKGLNGRLEVLCGQVHWDILIMLSDDTLYHLSSIVCIVLFIELLAHSIDVNINNLSNV